jgi:hypothetical protein
MIMAEAAVHAVGYGSWNTVADETNRLRDQVDVAWAWTVRVNATDRTDMTARILERRELRTFRLAKLVHPEV